MTRIVNDSRKDGIVGDEGRLEHTRGNINRSQNGVLLQYAGRVSNERALEGAKRSKEGFSARVPVWSEGDNNLRIEKKKKKLGPKENRGMGGS